MHRLKSAILSIFQKGLGWPCPVMLVQPSKIHHSTWKFLFVLGADEYLERLEVKIRKCLLFILKYSKITVWVNAQYRYITTGSPDFQTFIRPCLVSYHSPVEHCSDYSAPFGILNTRRHTWPRIILGEGKFLFAMKKVLLFAFSSTFIMHGEDVIS